MTIAMLCKNTIESAKQAIQQGWSGHQGSAGHHLEGLSGNHIAHQYQSNILPLDRIGHSSLNRRTYHPLHN